MKKRGKYEKNPQAKAAVQAKKTILQTYVTSLISLMLCVTMFFGTTAAWFTSEVESADNEIYVGILNVDLLKKVPADSDGNEWTSLKNQDGSNVLVFDREIKWEPNATTIETLKVRNQGDLSFQYRLNLIPSQKNTDEGMTEEEIQAIASQFEVYVRNETPGEENETFAPAGSIADLTGENGWTKLGTLEEVLAGKDVFRGSMDEADVNKEIVTDAEQNKKEKVWVEHTYSVALHMKAEATGMYVDSEGKDQTIMGKKLLLNVKLVATQNPSETDAFGDAYDMIFTEVSTAEELKAAFENGGNIRLAADIEISEKLEVKEGAEVYFDMNGKTLTVNNPNPSESAYCFVTRKDSTFTIDGNGVVDVTDPMTSLIFPGGDVIIENGTFVRNVPEGSDVVVFFMGAKVDPWGSQSVVINGGYFDGGYYDANAADIDEILAGTKEFNETDSANRGSSKDQDLMRVALKNNIMALLNLSSNLIKVYGGTFVGANPAWGDEGCMLPTNPNYLRPWSYYQGALIEGQEFNENGIVLPEGFSITKGETDDGRPTYTVNYSK